jgi:hypothetical protein
MDDRRFLCIELAPADLLAAAKAAGIIPESAALEQIAVARTFDDPDDGPPRSVVLRVVDPSFPQVPEVCESTVVKASVSLGETSRSAPPWGVVRPDDSPARSAGRVGGDAPADPAARPHYAPPRE